MIMPLYFFSPIHNLMPDPARVSILSTFFESGYNITSSHKDEQTLLQVKNQTPND
jgi:hypothetical protein